ncbi:MAG: tryptophan--tRNA ligase [Clostridiales Family XIII bacterium]|jgi:tryptophanyl-tRNA synthetase|nr:tryptophan--tRNA ligase [Clostridiales Family XIII bacterium]
MSIRVFSGVQPTGNIHIGNYLGALKQFVDLQAEGTSVEDVPHRSDQSSLNDCIYCIVDLHAITLPKDPAELRDSILDVAALYLAVGIDPKKSVVFVQSDVPGHAELAWILMCNSYTGELSRMTQFKDKSRGNESAPTGLFAYPVLMAADILLYDSNVVPVGSDQKQHIELTRDIAIRVNNKYGDDTFVVPEGRFLKDGARVMALDNPTAKMSKSAENPHSFISLLDDEAKIRKSIMRATTDSDGEIRFDPASKPGVSNLLTIYGAFTGKPVAEVEREWAGRGYGDFKKAVAEVTTDALEPIRRRYAEIRPSDELRAVLRDGAERAGAISEKVILRVKERFGLGA